MRTNSFLLRVHIDRFEDLDMIIGGEDEESLHVEIISAGDDLTFGVLFSGEEEYIFALGECLRRVSDILSSAPVYEET